MKETIEGLRNNIIEDYVDWVDTAMSGMEDRLGLKEIVVENFKEKIDKLIRECDR